MDHAKPRSHEEGKGTGLGWGTGLVRLVFITQLSEFLASSGLSVRNWDHRLGSAIRITRDGTQFHLLAVTGTASILLLPLVAARIYRFFELSVVGRMSDAIHSFDKMVRTIYTSHNPQLVKAHRQSSCHRDGNICRGV